MILSIDLVDCEPLSFLLDIPVLDALSLDEATDGISFADLSVFDAISFDDTMDDRLCEDGNE